jgi:hypothetical protein
MAQMAANACQWFGVAMLTRFTSLSSSILRMSVVNFGAKPCFWAIDSTRFWPTASSQSTIQVIGVSVRARKPPMWLPPRPFTPTTATFSRAPGVPAPLSADGSAAEASLPSEPAPTASAAANIESSRKRRRSI